MSVRTGVTSGLWLGLCTLALACSIDAGRNKAPRCSDEEGGYKGICIGQAQLDGGPPKDAGAALGPDGEVLEPCDEEGEVAVCYQGEPAETAQQPPCRAGIRTCSEGFWGACEQQVLPQEEICNGEDDNCNGQVDEDLRMGSCEVPDTHAECTRGVQVCMDGALACVQLFRPEPEMCNGKDDDCDGLADEDDPDLDLPCYDAGDDGCVAEGSGFRCLGECRAGVSKCIGGQRDDTCVGAQGKTEELATAPGGVLKDEDCDGQYDEGIPCQEGEYTCYTGPVETRGEGRCDSGIQVCTAGVFGTCEGEITPRPESCANMGEDDDCDGVPDDVPLLGTPCMDTTSSNQCSATARWRCRGGELLCEEGAEGVEICDGKDNDCDNAVDESCGTNRNCCGLSCVDLRSSNVHCGACGNACGAGLTCCGGECVDTATSTSHCRACGNVCGLLEVCRPNGCRTLGLL